MPTATPGRRVFERQELDNRQVLTAIQLVALVLGRDES